METTMYARLVLSVLAVLLLMPVGGRTDDVQKASTLTAEDKKYLDSLMKEFLFDPQGAERVSVKTLVRTVRGTSSEEICEGWFVRGADGAPDRVYFADGASILAPPERDRKKVDFPARCKARFAPRGEKDDLDFPERFRGERQRYHFDSSAEDLALAAWLYRCGEDSLATQALAEARKLNRDRGKELRRLMAWSVFSRTVHAYMVRADEEALSNGERFLRLYPDEIKEKHYPQAEQIVKDLKRRQKHGTFGKVPAEAWPDGFDQWSAEKQIAYLVQALDEVDVRQSETPYGVDLVSDRRVLALIRLGERAVPALLDVLEKDERLTHSVSFTHEFARDRTVVSVREAALTALEAILRMQFFTPNLFYDSLTRTHDAKAAKEVADRVRTFWERFGNLPLDERMMKVLTHRGTSFPARREAAENLASPNEKRHMGRWEWQWKTSTVHDSKPTPNPAVTKFSNPTTAEAMLSAMDAEVKDHVDKHSETVLGEELKERREIERVYLAAIVKLGDKRLAPKLAERAAAVKTARERCEFAYAAHQLGDVASFRAFADDFRAGKIEVIADGYEEIGLRNILSALTGAGTPEAEQAIQALTKPGHPQHALARKQLLDAVYTDSAWHEHPFCLTILRSALEDTTPTGAKFSIDRGWLLRKYETGESGSPIPEALADTNNRRGEAPERVCDVAAMNLERIVLGLPLYHPLLKDADKRLSAVKAAFDRYAGAYRKLERNEFRLLDMFSGGPVYVPAIRPLGRVATAADVHACRAIFHLDGKGKLSDLKLPAGAVLRSDEKKEHPRGSLIMQAEIGAKGEICYGVIGQHEIKLVHANELASMKTLADLQKEDREAAAKPKGR
jgi:hypothetical protein